MAVKYSTGLSDFLMQRGCFKRAFQNGKLQVRTGSQPATADTAVSGTLLCTYTATSGAHTAETLPQGSMTLTGGAAGSVDSIMIGGYEILGAVVPYNTSLTQTAADCVTQINKYLAAGCCDYWATSSGTKITFTAVRGSGNIAGVVTQSLTTITSTDVDVGTETAGVTPVNGLQFGTVSAGVLSKAGTWSGVAAATGVGGWFRLLGSVSDDGGAGTSYVRMDGTVGTSGADLNLATTSFTATNTYTIDTATFTLPLTA